MSVSQIQPNIIQNTLGQNVSPALSTMQNRIQPQVPMYIETPQKEKEKFTDIFEKIANAPDMNDTVTVPRTIFKGYLSFMVGTSLLTLGGLAKKVKPLSMALTALGTFSTIYGTYSFVRPYLMRERKPESKLK